MYDVKKLTDKLAEHGLEVAEDAAKVLVEDLLVWIEEEVKASETPYDDIALAVIPAIKPFIMSQLDKIDGKEG